MNQKANAATAAPGMITTSWSRTNGATRQTNAARAIVPARGRDERACEEVEAERRPEIRERLLEQQLEYISAGIIAAPVAAKIAQRLETSIRASRYVGKMTEVIVATPIALTTPYARVVSWIHHAGAIRYT